MSLEWVGVVLQLVGIGQIRLSSLLAWLWRFTVCHPADVGMLVRRAERMAHVSCVP